MNSPKTTARRAGILYAGMSVPGWFSLKYVPSHTFVAGDAAATARNILSHESLYRFGIVCEVGSEIGFVFLGLMFYELFKETDRKLARLLVVLVSVAAAIQTANALNLIAPLVLLNGDASLAAFTRPQLEALASAFLRLRDSGIDIVSAFWGLWLFPLGALGLKSGYFPRIVSALLIAAGFGWLTGSAVSIGAPEYIDAVARVTGPLVGIGEMLTMAWLITVGVRQSTPRLA